MNDDALHHGVARLTRLDPRAAWPNEAADFTPWLAENLDVLGEALGLDLELLDREAPVGGFSADLLARDVDTGRLVLVENQLEQTDHRHLGQLVTYAAGLDASVLVWVAKVLRDEHRQALDWLNRKSDSETSVFGVVVELVKIDASRPAVSLRLAAFPNTWGKQAKSQVETSETLSGRRAAYQAFFQCLVDELREKHKFTNSNVGRPDNWHAFPTGISSISYVATFSAGGHFRIELYIGTVDKDLNKRIFDVLLLDRETIERECDESLSWERLDNKGASRIAVYKPDSAIETASPDEVRSWAIIHLLKFKRVFGPRLRLALQRAEAALGDASGSIDTCAAED